jgi:hypothetical protein
VLAAAHHFVSRRGQPETARAILSLRPSDRQIQRAFPSPRQTQADQDRAPEPACVEAECQTARATNSPCSRISFGFRAVCDAANTACAEGIGATASRSRSTVPLHVDAAQTVRMRRTPSPAPEVLASARAWSPCSAEKELFPLGRISLSHARSRPVNSVPRFPPPASFPQLGESRSCLLLQFLLQFLEQVERLQRGEGIDVRLGNAIDDALR